MRGLLFVKKKISGAIKRIVLLFYPEAFPQHNIQKPDDPEMKALYRYCKGVGLDVGCGSRKTHPDAIGIDIIPKNTPGTFGSERRQFSQADMCLSGDNMYLFADNVFDYIVARHNLEHYQDPVIALTEWKRVLKKGGILGVVLPDDEYLDTIALDPTHKHAFTQDSYKNMLNAIGGFKITKLSSCIPHESFVCIARKI